MLRAGMYRLEFNVIDFIPPSDWPAKPRASGNLSLQIDPRPSGVTKEKLSVSRAALAWLATQAHKAM